MQEIIIYLAVTFVLAFLAESMTEYLLGTPFDKIPRLQPWKWLLMYAAAAVGVAMALHWKIDLVYLIAKVAGANDFVVSTFGMVLSGLSIGRGANFVHDLISKYATKPELPA